MSLFGSIASVVAPTFMAGLGTASSMFGPSDERMANRSYNRQMQDSISMWNMQNDYNSPKEQVKRLIDAGLNPAMMYERGGVDNTAGSLNLPSYPQVRGSNSNRDRLFEMATKFFLNKSMENAEDQSRENALNEEYLGLRNDFMRERLNQLKNDKKSGISEDSSISTKDLIDMARLQKLNRDLENPYGSGSLTNVRTYQNALNPNFREVYGNDWALKEGLYGRKVKYPTPEQASRWRSMNKFNNIMNLLMRYI